MDERHEDMEAHTMESVMQRQNEAFAEAAARQSEALLAAMGRSGHGAPGGMQLPPGVNPFSFNPALASALGLGGGGMHPGMHLGDMPHRRGSPGHGSSPDKK